MSDSILPSFKAVYAFLDGFYLLHNMLPLTFRQSQQQLCSINNNTAALWPSATDLKTVSIRIIIPNSGSSSSYWKGSGCTWSLSLCPSCFCCCSHPQRWKGRVKAGASKEHDKNSHRTGTDLLLDLICSVHFSHPQLTINLFVFIRKPRQGERSWAPQQIRPLQASCATWVLRVDRAWRCFCGLSGPTPYLHSPLADVVQKAQAPSSSPQPNQSP